MKISVGNLSTYATEKDLMQLFSAFGNVISAVIAYDSYNHRSRGMANVVMETESSAMDAIQRLHNTFFMQKSLVVKAERSLTR